ncbi:hypothetical protein BDV93DRAFT_48561 [Ceratobasidium sp. AG-I]|nr:hypothetical protein BDV93DRAFT_48561 [Ceratobasidium sp. AG-I]
MPWYIGGFLPRITVSLVVSFVINSNLSGWLRTVISQMKLSKPTYTLLILPVDERSRVTNPILRKNGVIEHPEANQWTTIGPNSYLSSMRRKTITVLSTINPQRIKKIYEIQLARSGSPLEVARRANRFVARVLLHGDSSDGSTVFKPIGERPSAKAKLVKRKFEAAVGLGLVHVAQP